MTENMPNVVLMLSDNVLQGIQTIALPSSTASCRSVSRSWVAERLQWRCWASPPRVTQIVMGPPEHHADARDLRTWA